MSQAAASTPLDDRTGQKPWAMQTSLEDCITSLVAAAGLAICVFASDMRWLTSWIPCPILSALR
jgi:hypothetical protein